MPLKLKYLSIVVCLILSYFFYTHYFKSDSFDKNMLFVTNCKTVECEKNKIEQFAIIHDLQIYDLRDRFNEKIETDSLEAKKIIERMETKFILDIVSKSDFSNGFIRIVDMDQREGIFLAQFSWKEKNDFWYQMFKNFENTFSEYQGDLEIKKKMGSE